MEHSITRMAVATEKEAEKQQGDNRTMGRKNTIPYGPVSNPWVRIRSICHPNRLFRR